MKIARRGLSRHDIGIAGITRKGPFQEAREDRTDREVN